jgi:hypothetical protein
MVKSGRRLLNVMMFNLGFMKIEPLIQNILYNNRHIKWCSSFRKVTALARKVLKVNYNKGNFYFICT